MRGQVMRNWQGMSGPRLGVVPTMTCVSGYAVSLDTGAVTPSTLCPTGQTPQYNCPQYQAVDSTGNCAADPAVAAHLVYAQAVIDAARAKNPSDPNIAIAQAQLDSEKAAVATALAPPASSSGTSSSGLPDLSAATAWITQNWMLLAAGAAALFILPGLLEKR